MHIDAEVDLGCEPISWPSCHWSAIGPSENGDAFADETLPSFAHRALEVLIRRMAELTDEIGTLDEELKAWPASNEASRRLAASCCKHASGVTLRLTPQQQSTGGKTRLGGIQFAEQPRNRNSVTFRKMRFDLIWEANDIENQLTKPNHPRTNGQVERMNRTIKDATVKRYHYQSHDQLRGHLRDFLDVYNFARRLKHCAD